MGTKTTAIVGPGGPEDPAALRAQIAETRNEMSGTLEELHGRLNPTVLKEQAVEQFHDAAEKVKAELKQHFADAKEALKEHLQEAKVAIKDEVQNQTAHAKQAVRDATIGKVENMVHKTQDRIRDTGESVTELVRENPIPAALTGIGLAWLLLGGRRKRRMHRQEMRSQRVLAPRYDYEYEAQAYYDAQGYYDADGYRSYYEGDDDVAGRGYAMDDEGRGGGRISRMRGRASEMAGQAGRKISGGAHDAASAVSHVAHDAAGAVAGAAHGARDAVTSAAHTVGDTAVEIAHGARERAAYMARGARMQARRVGRRSSDIFRDNPLAVGAAMIALGTVVGMALPRTELEDQWMGNARDQVFGRAQEAVHEVVGRAEEAVSQAVGKASDAVQHLGESSGSESQGGMGGQPNGRVTPRA